MDDKQFKELIEAQKELTKALQNTNEILLKLAEYKLSTMNHFSSPESKAPVKNDLLDLKMKITGSRESPVLL